MIKDSYKTKLSPKEVDAVSEKILTWTFKTRANKKDIIRLRISVEEALLSFLDRYGEGLDVTVSYIVRLDTYIVELSCAAEPFHPFAKDDIHTDDWSNEILCSMGQKAIYRYKDGNNRLIFSIPKKRYNSEIFLVVAILLAVAFGVMGSYIPEVVKDTITAYGLDLISTVFLHMLGIFSGLVIFFSLVNGMCGMGSVSDFSKVGRSIITRYIVLAFAGGSVLTFLATFFFRFEWGGGVNGNSVLDQIKEIILSIFPSNPISPFLEGDMLQIIFLAVLAGILLLTLGERVGGIRRFIGQGNDFITKGVGIVCKFLPVFIFSSFLSMFWSMGFGVFKTLWKPIVVTLVLGMAIPLFKLLEVSIRFRKSPFVMIRSLSKTLLVSFVTASSIIAYPVAREELTEKLGIEKQFVEFAFPVGINMYTASYMLVYLSTVLYLAEQSRTPVSVIWIVLAGFFSIVFAIATPTVSGGTLICIGIMLNNLKLPAAGLALAGSLTIVLDFYLTGIRNFSRALDIYITAKKFGKVNEAVLPNKKG